VTDGRKKVNEKAMLLILKLQEAFRDVKLGNGVGLYEALEIDSYSRDEMREKARERDEKDNWERLGPNELRGTLVALGYLDPEGMRFYLPAYLRAEIISPFIDDLLPTLVLKQAYPIPSRSYLRSRSRPHPAASAGRSFRIQVRHCY
jgi:hypothetical protein